MDQEIENYLNSVVQDCLTAVPALNKEQLEDYFSQVILETLIYSLNDEQVKEIENLDFNSPEASEKIQLLAASVPGFILIVQDVLKQEVDQIKQAGQIPQ